MRLSTGEVLRPWVSCRYPRVWDHQGGPLALRLGAAGCWREGGGLGRLLAEWKR